MKGWLREVDCTDAEILMLKMEMEDQTLDDAIRLNSRSHALRLKIGHKFTLFGR